MITAAVGTFIHGFDELLQAADQATASLQVQGMAQIGHSRYLPRHLKCQRFFNSSQLMQQLSASHVLICHAGMGLIGDGLRANCHIILFPRRGATTRQNPANDQTDFAIAVARRLQLDVCLNATDLPGLLANALKKPPAVTRAPVSDVPSILADYLAATSAT